MMKIRRTGYRQQRQGFGNASSVLEGVDEEASRGDDMEVEMQLPKNIRQIGDREERIRVYLEDFADTFLKKLCCGNGVRAGLLLGTRSVVQGKRCMFVRGAVELEETEIQADFSEKLWESLQNVVQEYFSDCSVCGWFVCGSPGAVIDHEALKQTHRQVFAGDGSILFFRGEKEEAIWIEEEACFSQLTGYYIYYEKNPQMQSYMSSRKQPDREEIPDQAARSFRRIMTQKEHKTEIDYGKWMKAGVGAALALLIAGTIATAGRREPTEPQKLPVLLNNLTQSHEETQSQGQLQPGEEQEAASAAQDTAEAVSKLQAEQTAEQTAEAVPELQAEQTAEQTAEAVPELQAEQTAEAVSELQAEQTAEAVSELQAEQTAEAVSELQAEYTAEAAQGSNIFTEDMQVYRDSWGAVVYRMTKPDQTKEEAAVIPEKKLGEYVVMPGDTLLGISVRFYGTSDMVMEIKRANGLEDVNRINIGQTLILP